MMPQVTLCQGCGKLIQHAPGYCFHCGTELGDTFNIIVLPKSQDQEPVEELVAA